MQAIVTQGQRLMLKIIESQILRSELLCLEPPREATPSGLLGAAGVKEGLAHH